MYSQDKGELSDSFETNEGLRQSDALSPKLFNLILESVIRMRQQRRMKVIESHILLALLLLYNNHG